MNFVHGLLLAAAIALGGSVSAPEMAEAKIVLVNWGDDIFETGPLPAPYDRHPELHDWQMNAWEKHGRWLFAGLIVLGLVLNDDH